MIKMILPDPQYLTREGFKSIIADVIDLRIISEANASTQLREMIALQQPLLVVIDPFQSAAFSIDDVLFIKANFPATRLLVFSGEQSKSLLQQIVPVPVKNCISKFCDTQELISAIYDTTNGKHYVCRRTYELLFGRKPILTMTEVPNLSAREAELVHLFAAGLTNRQIATRLYLSFHTVRTHRRNILKKLLPHFSDLNEFSALLISLSI